MYYLVISNDITKIKESEALKDEFISIASHELRTPMTIINGFSCVLLEEKFGKLNDKQSEYLKKINQNTTGLINIVNDMLDIGKIESNNIILDEKELDVKTIIRETIQEF
jgi:signal transduction histidine kinase